MIAFARSSLRFGTAGAACLAALAMTACGTGSSPAPSSNESASSTAVQHDTGASAPIEIKTLSNRADLISGGDAYVELVLPKPEFATALRVELNGRNIRDTFAFRGNTGRMLGVVTGLADGRNVLRASVGQSS